MYNRCIGHAEGWPLQQRERVADQKGKLTNEQLLEPQDMICICDTMKCQEEKRHVGLKDCFCKVPLGPLRGIKPRHKARPLRNKAMPCLFSSTFLSNPNQVGNHL